MRKIIKSAFMRSIFSNYKWYRKYYGGRWERHWIDICGSHIWLNMKKDQCWPEYRQPCSHGTPEIENW